MERTEALQQKLEHWCSTSVRALAGDPSIHFRGHHLFRKESPFFLQAPYLQLSFETHDNRKLRGVADSIALRLKHSDHELHESLKPEIPIEQLVFEILEQLRAESMAPDVMPGMRINLRERFLFWANQAAVSQLVENSVGLLIFTINIIAWSRLHRQPIPEVIEEVIEATRWGLVETIGSYLRAMSNCYQDQAEFSEHALAIANIINKLVDDEANSDANNNENKRVLRGVNNSKQFKLQWLDVESSVALQRDGVSVANDIAVNGEHFKYTVFNSAYDKEVQASKMIRGAQLKKLRLQLDKRISQQSVNTHRVARYLKQLLAIPAISGWVFGKYVGYLDSARLSRLITSPSDHRLFRRETYQPSSDCVVSIVIDNSGSMTHHNEKVAAFVDTLVKVLEIAEVKSEVLGFTTVDWNGGRVAKEWAASGKPSNPGRLTSLYHTIYKAADRPWRRSREAIAGLLKSDNFREGVDGEALEWAAKRIENRPENTKIIIMVSDGSPMDTSTLVANSDRYLDNHLAQVASAIEKRPDIKLCGVGVGLDLSAYYRENISISLNKEMTTKDYLSIVDLLIRSV